MERKDRGGVVEEEYGRAMRRGWRNGVQGARCRKCGCLRCLTDERELWAVGQEWCRCEVAKESG